MTTESEELTALRQALARAEGRLRETERLAGLGSWELDLASGRLTWSEEIFRLFELDPARFGASYEAFLDCVHPDDRARVDAAYKGAVAQRTPYAISHRLLMRDGRIKHVEERGETFYDDAGSPVRSVGTVQDVTRDVGLQARLQARERLLQTIVDASPDLIVAKDLDHRLIMANRAYARFLGREVEEIVGQRDDQLWARAIIEGDPGAGLVGIREGDLCALAGVAYRDVSLRVPDQYGRMRHFEVVKGPLPGADGRVEGVFGYCHDVTERVETERRLVESEARMRGIFEAEPECVVLLDGSGAVVDMNAAGLAMCEVESLADVVGSQAGDLVAPEHGAAFAELVAAVFRGESRRLEYALVGRRGTRRWLETHAVPLRSPIDQRITRLLAVTRDTTERHRHENALRRSERRYRAVVEDQTELIARWHPERGPSFVNEALSRFCGIEPGELARLGFWPLVPEDERAMLHHHFATLTPEQPVGTVEHRLVLPDGRVRWTQWTNRALFGGDGALFEYQSVGRDVTEEHEAHARLARELEHKEVLFRELHHRVKNNLQVVASLLALQEQTATVPTAAAALAESRTRILAMAMVHERLYSSGTGGRINVAGYARELGRSLLASFGAAHVQLEVEGAGFGLELDRAIPFGLILNELVSNALKHAFPGGRAGRIRVLFSQEGDDGLVEIADDGVGIDPARATGRSLGLRLVPRLAAQLGGRLETRPGRGTAYTLTVPRVRP